MILATTSVTLDPAWPWSLPGVGVAALAGVALLLAALTVWTYRGVRGASAGRIGLVLGLRLMALVVALVVVLRPSLAFQETSDLTPSRIFLLLDASESMKVTDDFNNLSRWDNARRILSSPSVKNTLRKLTEAKVQIGYYQAAEDLRMYDPDSQPTGKATDMGTWLHQFLEQHGRDKDLRGLFLFTDGADNGVRFPTLEEAGRLRGICSVFTFGLGRTTTTSRHNDIALTDIRVAPEPIPAKGKITVTGYVNAPGFENTTVNVSLWMAAVGAKEPKLAGTLKHVLKKTARNEVILTADAPEAAGEIKVTLKIQPLDGEVSTLNNEISTFASVTKDGVSILWVEGAKRYESVFAIRGLRQDPRFRVYFSERLNEAQPGPEIADWFDFDKRHYDVIVIGDISARRFAGGDASVFAKINRLVTEKGTGLFMMGGYETPWGEGRENRGNDWNQPASQPLVSLLPVAVGNYGQIEAKVLMEPTKDGEKYLLKLAESPAKNEQIWTKVFDPLDGATRLGALRPTSTLLAQGEINKEPLLVETRTGNGRVLVFAGDTTWKVWERSEEALSAHARFWKQLMLYLARQENSDGNVRITLDKRRLPADGTQRLPFTVQALGKDGLAVINPQFTVKVTGPDQVETEVPVTLEGSEYRGYFLKVNAAGDYRLEASVKGKDAAGNELAAKSSVAHFLGYSQDREMLRPAADHELLAKIAAASGGQFAPADERMLVARLEEVLAQRDNVPHARALLWPDWRGNPISEAVGDQVATLWNSTALPCFLVFVTLLCTEWYLRRRWGLV